MLVALMAEAMFSPVIGGVNSRYAPLEDQRQGFPRESEPRSVI